VQPLPTTAQAGYDWINAEDVLRHALAAYYATCREYDAWQIDPNDSESVRLHQAWARPEFAATLAQTFTDRLHQAGVSEGVRGFHPRPSENTPSVLSGPEFPNIADTQDIHRAQLMAPAKGEKSLPKHSVPVSC
jgi:hypothetical protein